jgi:hypothetical protein
MEQFWHAVPLVAFEPFDSATPCLFLGMSALKESNDALLAHEAEASVNGRKATKTKTRMASMSEVR